MWFQCVVPVLNSFVDESRYLHRYKNYTMCMMLASAAAEPSSSSLYKRNVQTPFFFTLHPIDPFFVPKMHPWNLEEKQLACIKTIIHASLKLTVRNWKNTQKKEKERHVFHTSRPSCDDRSCYRHSVTTWIPRDTGTSTSLFFQKRTLTYPYMRMLWDSFGF